MMRALPAFSEVQRELTPLLPNLYAAVEYGAQESEEFFSRPGLSEDSCLFAHLLRYFAQRYLKGAGIELAEFEVDPQNNSGVLIRYGRYRIRILKARKSGVPLPGQSQRRLEEYRQVAFSEQSETWDDRVLDTAVNLLLLWEVDPPKRVVVQRLAMTQAEAHDPEAFALYWTEILPHPSESLAVSVPEMTTTVDLDDLPISVIDTPEPVETLLEVDVAIDLPKNESGDEDTTAARGQRRRSV